MGYAEQEEWNTHYAQDRRFRSLGETERALLAEHVPAPGDGGRALDVGCGLGELAVHLASAGYTVDAVDWADSALDHARATSPAGVRWLRLDVERDDLALLEENTYDLITLRLAYTFLGDRTRIMHDLGRRLREDGAIVVITPLAAHTPAKKRDIALDEHEISLLSAGWEQVQRFDTDGLAVVILRSPRLNQIAVAEKHKPAAHAVTGACAVVTDVHGRVLLGRSTSTMWELPGGRTEGSEPFEQAAVRELAEETGLIAEVADGHVLSMLWDDNQGISRLTAVVRITAHSGTLACREPDKFTRWEWHPLHTLAHLDQIFAPSAQALDAVWPGVLPGLAPVHAYPHAIIHPRVDGEPAQAVRLRQDMTAKVFAGGWAPSNEVRQALRAVPRHRFTPESPLTTAYDDDLAVITRRDDEGQATSSVSAAWLQADMIESLHLEPGLTVCEVGSGGYNAELLAHVLGPVGRVVSVDIDPYVIARTRRFTAEAGSGRVNVLLGDGRLGAPGHVPGAGFDGCVITHNCWDIAPAWREQLAEGRYLVLPLEIHGYTRAITFQKHGDVLHARGFTFCGFVRDLGSASRTTPVADVRGGELQLRFEDGEPADVSGIEDALRGPRHEVPTGVTVAPQESFETLQLYLATTVPGFCRLALDRDRDIAIAAVPRGANAPAVLGDGSMAYLTHVPVTDTATSEQGRAEFIAHAYGLNGPRLAEQLATAVRSWDQHVRPHGYPELTVFPAGTADRDLPTGHVLDKPHSRLVFTWNNEGS
ncbi:methyltransferase, FxLD system [Streptomyces sp. NPDC058469]|uniref:methyltransferase, FxLD system n=1 Tax=Streptomyces sp. NPDC058469 TaxID=3346514 RepID=UPI00364DF14E